MLAPTVAEMCGLKLGGGGAESQASPMPLNSTYGERAAAPVCHCLPLSATSADAARVSFEIENASMIIAGVFFFMINNVTVWHETFGSVLQALLSLFARQHYPCDVA